jgi:hypothetical protein
MHTVKPGYKHGLRTEDYMLVGQDMLISNMHVMIKSEERVYF